MKYAFIQAHRPVFSVRAMCRGLRVHPNGFYAWLKSPFCKRSIEDKRQTELLKEAWEDSGKVYGYCKLHDDLRDQGETCCPNRVARLARLADIKAQIGYKRRPGIYCGFYYWHYWNNQIQAYRDIMPMFLDKHFRQNVVSKVTDPHVRDFWVKEFPIMNYKGAVDGVPPIANKLGGFLSHPLVRKAMCEPDNPLRFRKIMDDGQFLIVNLSKGKIGADIANILGGMILSSIANAAYSRQNQQEADRLPFILYADSMPTNSIHSPRQPSRECFQSYGNMVLGLYWRTNILINSIGQFWRQFWEMLEH